MAEKDNKNCCSATKTSSKLIIGVVLIILGLLAVITWLQPLVILIKGCLGLFLIMAGAVTIAISKE